MRIRYGAFPFPGFFDLQPLAIGKWFDVIVFFIEFYVMGNGHHIGLSNGLVDFICVQCAGPFDGVRYDLNILIASLTSCVSRFLISYFIL